MNNEENIRPIALNLFVFFISIFLLTATETILYSSDASWARYETTKSIVEKLDLSIPGGLGIRGDDGREYYWGGIGQALLAIPFYIAGKFVGAPENAVSMMNYLFGAAVATLIFLFSASLGYSERASLFVSIFYGIGTMAWPLAKQPFDHTVETFFILLSVYFLHLHGLRKRPLYLLQASLSIGVAFITRPTSVLTIPALLILIITHRSSKTSNFTEAAKLALRDSALFLAAFLPFVCLVLCYNYCRFGSIFETGYQMMASHLGLDFFLGMPLVTGIKGFLVSPAKGYFYYSPIALLFFFSMKSFSKKHPETAACFAVIIMSYPIFFSKNIYWHGDWAWGPRYLLAITPFLILPIAGLFDSNIWKEKKIIRVAVWSLFIVSFIVQLGAVSVDFQKYFIHLRYEEGIEFTVAEKEGVPSIVEPPAEIYFDWHRSPIITQFRFVGEMLHRIGTYKYYRLRADAPFVEKIKADPHMNVFDFWWLYEYLSKGSYSILAVLFILLGSSVWSATRFWTLADSLTRRGKKVG